MARNSHLETEVLFNYATGKTKLSEEQAAHLAKCEECREAIDAIRRWPTSSVEPEESD